MVGWWIAMAACSSAPEAVAPAPAPVAPAARRGRRDDPDDDAGRPERRRPDLARFEAPADPCGELDRSGVFTVDVSFEGKEWTSLLYVPPGPGPRDLVVVLHGGDGTPEKILAQTDFEQAAAGHRVAVLAPASAEVPGHEGRHWNSGNHPEGEVGGRDDVAYLDTVAAAVAPQVCAKRILAAGFSNGGQMAHRWACQGKQPVALLSAAGRLLVPPSTCTQRPFLGYVGTLDPNFDRTPHDGPNQVSVKETFDLWAKINGCKGESEADPKDAQCRVGTGCAEPTELCILPGLHHAWPSPHNRKKPTDTDASVDGLAWFQALPGGGGAPDAPAPDEGRGRGRKRR
ncbi:MAG: PHB depolymerase family esterase [Myxococcota bacterium]